MCESGHIADKEEYAAGSNRTVLVTHDDAGSAAVVTLTLGFLLRSIEDCPAS